MQTLFKDYSARLSSVLNSFEWVRAVFKSLEIKLLLDSFELSGDCDSVVFGLDFGKG